MQDVMQDAFERAQRDPFYLACALALYARANSMDMSQVATRLNVDMPTLARLGLCRWPQTEAEVVTIAARFGCQATDLARIARL